MKREGPFPKTTGPDLNTVQTEDIDMIMTAIELIEKNQLPTVNTTPRNIGMKRKKIDTEKKIREEEETPVLNLGLDLEIYLEIGLVLEMYLGMTRRTGDIGIISQEIGEILALEPEMYLVIGIEIKV